MLGGQAYTRFSGGYRPALTGIMDISEMLGRDRLMQFSFPCKGLDGLFFGCFNQ